MLIVDTRLLPGLSARERILRTAHRLFNQDGIRATGIDRLIAESGVTKVTFYRHFPSKNDLVLAFLEERHERWMSWFQAALARYGGTLHGLVPVLGEWFKGADFRGCAFLNSVSELGEALPEINEITRRHKGEVVAVLIALLPPSRKRKALAEAAALALDGAIVQAQFSEHLDPALRGLGTVLKALEMSKP